jgi:hypothetical protein
MLSLEPIRDALRAQPFRPFTIRTSDGREYRVTHPEAVAISPRARALLLWYDDEHWEVLDVLHIAGIHYGNGKAARPRRKRKS